MKDFSNKMKILLSTFALLVLIGGSYFLGTRHSKKETLLSQKDNKSIYSCPMHPSILSETPGQCPICHMDLQKVEKDNELTQSVESKKTKKILFYKNPMRPDITSPVPSKDEMGMDYIPVYEGDDKDDNESNVSANGSANVSDRAGFKLSPSRQQLIGVTTGKVEKHPLTFEIRASGKVAFDPDLFTAIEEYRQALQSLNQMKESPFESLKVQASELVESAKTKLRLLGLADNQIRKLATTTLSAMNLLLPKGNAWIYAEVYEYELAQVKEGQLIEVTTPSLSGKSFIGKITSVSPIVNPQTRTARVRALVPDKEGQLRPDAFVNVKIEVTLGEKLTVPAEAILHSGEETFVFIAEDNGQFTPRKIQLGTKARDLYEVKSGLNEGEKVVTSANFLIDSESRLRGVLKKSESSNPQASKTETPHSMDNHTGHGGSP